MAAGADGFPAALFFESGWLLAPGCWLKPEAKSQKREANSSQPEALPSDPSPEVRAQDFGSGLPLGFASLTPAKRLNLTNTFRNGRAAVKSRVFHRRFVDTLLQRMISLKVS